MTKNIEPTESSEKIDQKKSSRKNHRDDEEVIYDETLVNKVKCSKIEANEMYIQALKCVCSDNKLPE